MTESQARYPPTRSLSARGPTTRPTTTTRVRPRSTSHAESSIPYSRSVGDANGRDEGYEPFGEESTTHWYRNYGSTQTHSASFNNYEMHRHQLYNDAPSSTEEDDYLEEEELQIRNSARTHNIGVGHYGGERHQPLFRSESDNSVRLRRATRSPSPYLDSTSLPASRAYSSASNLSSHYEGARNKHRPYPLSPPYYVDEPHNSSSLYDTSTSYGYSPSPVVPPFTPSPTKMDRSRSREKNTSSVRTPGAQPVLIPQLTPALKGVNSIRVIWNEEEDTSVLSDYLQDASAQYQSTVESIQAKLKALKSDIEKLSPPPSEDHSDVVQYDEPAQSPKNSLTLVVVVISVFVFLVAIIWYQVIVQSSVNYDVLYPA